MKKRNLSTLLTLVLCLALLPMAAFAADNDDTGEAAHQHCVCGETHAAVGDHENADEQTFAAWESNDNLPDTAGQYYLTQDVTLKGVQYVWNNVVLCLNGHTITLDAEDAESEESGDSRIVVDSGCNLTVTDCKTGTAQGKITHAEGVTGGAVQNNGTFNLYGGVITGNTGSSGAGVYNNGTFNLYGGVITGNTGDLGVGVYNNGSTFNMYGGEISNNASDMASDLDPYGAGVYVDAASTFSMSGGTIKGNTTRVGGGVYVLGTFHMSGTATVTENRATSVVGGVYVATKGDGNGKMTVGGSAKVWGNTYGSAGSLEADNIAVSAGNYITLNSDPLTDSAKFGIVTYQEEAYTVVKGIGAYKDRFSSDNVRYELVVDGDDLKLQKKEHYIVVNDTEITEANADDVLGDGSVKYDKATKTLTLTNATINKGHPYWGTREAGIYTYMNGLTIDLVGNNTIAMPSGTVLHQSCGIFANDLTIRTSSGTGSLTVTAADAGSTYGISLGGDLTVDENVTLNVKAGKAYGSLYTDAYSYGIAAHHVTIGKNAKVTAVAGNIDAPLAVDSRGIYADGNVIVKDGATVTATGGMTSTNDSNSYSAGIYANGYISIGNARVTATGGDAYGRCDPYTSEGDTKSFGGWARTFGAACYGPIMVNDGANVKFAAGNASVGGDSVNDANVSSNGLWIDEGYLQMDGGAVYVKSGTAVGGNFATDGLSIWCDSDETSGNLMMNAGWLKVETNDVAILTEKNITLGEGVTVHTPENGTVGTYNKYDIDCGTIVDKDGEKAATVLLWDGTTAAYTEPVSDSDGGGGSSNTSGGGSSSNTTSTTVKNPDGSTTTTVTDKKTGTVTETTKNTDGSTTTIETKKDGTVTEINTTATGTTSTTVTDKDGNSTTTVSVSQKDAQSGNTVTLPVDEVTAAGKSEDAQEIAVEVPSGGATVEIPVKNPTPGTVVVIVDKDGNETVVPTSKVTENGIEVTLTEGATIKIVENSTEFDDVTENDYYNDAVDWASSRGITSGTTETSFSPDSACTRSQLVTFLWRAAGQPEAEGDHDFTDVEEDSYYAEAIAWAASLGIVDGYGNGLFGSDDTITREQMAVILYRFAQTMGMDTTQGGMDVSEYKDYESISDYAVAAIQWAVNAGIMQGYDGNLMPTQPCTRAQIVTMLYRLLGE